MAVEYRFVSLIFSENPLILGCAALMSGSYVFLCFQDTWEEVDPYELSYEELVALGEVIGTESIGLSIDTIASLPLVTYKAQSNQDGSAKQCVICWLEYEDEDTLTMLSCKHSYHSECINNWLKINKVCVVVVSFIVSVADDQIHTGCATSYYMLI
ncbi:hypothetical protein IFM89_009256 [Coptis chinensis]|uniref:RING-type domain-containing protein n=1 Tax=Coptis chinensis TaxID=261450 RepID=A0A835M7J2_9MAGN|nr:hypothetical protein IFM89_009256 [Coptis chinensis]